MAGVLGLQPHREGGHFRETYRSPVTTPTPVGTRPLSTAIVYLLTESDPSRFHRLRFDELWFFHAGSPVEMVFLDPLETLVLGPGAPQALAPGGRWMAARVPAPGSEGGSLAGMIAAQGLVPTPECATEEALAPDPAWAMVGCVVSPGFEYDDFEPGHADQLLRAYPEAADYILTLAGG